MKTKFGLDGGIIRRSLRHLIDGRDEARVTELSVTGVMEFRGHKHVVRLVNTSASGAMVIFSQVPHIGEQVSLQLLDRGQVTAKVRWVRDGRIGIGFDGQLE